ncbi:dihydroorotase [Spiribacter sp. C176]|uniref:Dihydroorotase n=1 Tax=Spiribacter salilacus TaxID=2664894 RepID=A0A6N7QRI0_9GAMM|nr:dihydroorotase [Spiribacter salilacus]MRH78009.1 dihydroorotase [Spiribacter salilacus]
MSRLLISQGRILDPASGYDEIGDVAIADGRIVDLGSSIGDFSPERTIDAKGLWVIPGLIDLSARLREPGATRKADIASEARAAAAAGITTLVMPPDTQPVIDMASVVDLIQHRAEGANAARVVPLGALTQGLLGEHLAGAAALAAAGCPALSDGGQPVQDTLVLRRALEYAKTFGLPCLLTPLDTHLAQGCLNEGATATRLGLPGVPVAAETAGLGRQLPVAEVSGARVHFGRLSSEAGVRLLDQAKQHHPELSADVAIHQLFLTEQDAVGYDTRFHVQPPLRSIFDRQALRQALKAGTIGIICSDHQPHEPDAKEGPFANTAAGASGLDTLLSLILRLVEEEVIDLLPALATVTSKPAELLGLESGRLAAGAVADIAVIDPHQPWWCTPKALKSRGKNSPFLGWELNGRALWTFVGGRPVHTASADR